MSVMGYLKYETVKVETLKLSRYREIWFILHRLLLESQLKEDAHPK